MNYQINRYMLLGVRSISAGGMVGPLRRPPSAVRLPNQELEHLS